MASLKKPIFIYLTITKNYSNILKNDPIAYPSPFLLTYPSSSLKRVGSGIRLRNHVTVIIVSKEIHSVANHEDFSFYLNV